MEAISDVNAVIGLKKLRYLREIFGSGRNVGRRAACIEEVSVPVCRVAGSAVNIALSDIPSELVMEWTDDERVGGNAKTK